MDIKILIIIISIEIMMIHVFLSKKGKYKIFLYSILLLSIYYMKEITVTSSVDVDVVWGINFITNLLIISNIITISAVYIYVNIIKK